MRRLTLFGLVGSGDSWLARREVWSLSNPHSENTHLRSSCEAQVRDAQRLDKPPCLVDAETRTRISSFLQYSTSFGTLELRWEGGSLVTQDLFCSVQCSAVQYCTPDNTHSGWGGALSRYWGCVVHELHTHSWNASSFRATVTDDKSLRDDPPDLNDGQATTGM